MLPPLLPLYFLTVNRQTHSLVGIFPYFHWCFPTPLALISVAMGICSIFCWLAAQIPQIRKNYGLQDTGGLSIYFFVQ